MTWKKIWTELKAAWRKLFGPPPGEAIDPVPSQKLTCPYCLGQVEKGRHPVQCGSCAHELPILYVEDSQRYRVDPVQVFGWMSHGKTVFLYALTLMLDRLNIVMGDFSSVAVTEASRRMLIDVRRYQNTGTMPPPTPLGTDDAYVMLLEGLERWGSRALVIRDCAGEVFDNIEIDVELVPYLLKTRTTFMVVSLPDLDPSDGRSMDMLMTNYLSTMIRHQGLKTQRNLVVVFTKADAIGGLPRQLQTYLLDDPLSAALSPDGGINLPHGQKPVLTAENLEAYLATMRTVHRTIEDWLERERLAVNFVNQARHRGVNYRFSIISATGTAVGEDDVMPVTWQPRRVLDPYFWALEFERTALGTETPRES